MTPKKLCKEVEHKQLIGEAKFQCGYCGGKFPIYYYNKREAQGGMSYWGNGQKYNFRGATANFWKHVNACKARLKELEGKA